MYSAVSNPIVDIYDYYTNEYIGRARFKLNRETERTLLDLANHTGTPSTLMLQNVEFIQTAGNYVPLAPYQRIRRRAVLTATFVDSVSRSLVPIEFRYTYDTIVRSPPNNNIFTSVEVSNIQIENIIPLV